MTERQSVSGTAVSSNAARPVLYSFRRCPYAMRARLALSVSGQRCALREIVLRDKPAEMIAASPKATVPVLQLPDGRVLEQSLDIMHWALARHDPEQWLEPETGQVGDMDTLIAACDGDFKHHLDRYKYAPRYGPETDPECHRSAAMVFLKQLNARLETQGQLFGARPSLADFAIFPFVRQFANTDRDWFNIQDLPGLQVWLAGHLNATRFQDVMTKWPVWRPGDVEPVFPEPV